MEAKFTPGPWLTAPHPDPTCSCVSIVDEATYEEQLKWGTTDDGYVSGHTTCYLNAEANARLIAAAPDLYHALTAAVEIIDKWIEPEAMGIVRSGDGVLGHCLRDEYLMNLRAALAKAKDAQPHGTPQAEASEVKS